jgi:uncharacterized protein (TIGR03118 family)
VNAWGITATASSPLWIADNGTGTSVIYNGAGVKQGLTVNIPGAAPITGIVANGTAGFNGDTFLFDAENGGLYGWRGALGTTAETLMLPSPTNEYKGLAIATIGGFQYAYLANFKTGNIDVVAGEGGAPPLGSLTDPNLPPGYAPFNVQVLNGVLYVTYAEPNGMGDEIDAPGLGLVDKFSLNGTFLGRIATGGVLDAPWGLAIAPAGFADLAGDLLVGNFGDGSVDAYNLSNNTLVETLSTGSGPLMIDGLWGLRFGSGTTNGGPATTLYFTAGPGGESHGQFGEIVANPEPGTWGLCIAGLLLVGQRMIATRRRSR